MPKIFEKYEATSTLISTDIENLVREAMSRKECEQTTTTTTAVAQKRKHDSTGENNKENKLLIEATNSRVVQPLALPLKRFKSALAQSKDKEVEYFKIIFIELLNKNIIINQESDTDI